MAIKKKHIVVGGIALLSVTAAILYWQFMKLKDSAIKLAGVKFNGLTQKTLNFDLILLFTNQSKITINIISQEYKVYLNNILVTTVSNAKPVIIDKLSNSPITVNVAIDNTALLNALKANYKDIILFPERVSVRVDCAIKVKLFGIGFNIPYVYVSNLKELMSKSKQG